MPRPAPHRDVAEFGPVVCVDLGVPHDWGVMASAGLEQPTDVDIERAMTWVRARGARHGARIAVPESEFEEQDWGLAQVVDRLPLYATVAASAAAIPIVIPDGLLLHDAAPHADIVEGYGVWMGDHTLAELLLTPDDVAHPDRRFIVAREHGRIVGCAFVWFAAGTAYLSGLGVAEDRRGRGIGRALTAASARLAVSSGRDVDVVWMFATDDGAALYGQMGFQVVDVEVSFDAMTSRSRSA